MPLSKELLSQHVSDAFIETGTHRGDGVKCALDVGFGEVYTCEYEPHWLARMPRELIDDDRVMIGVGDSSGWLNTFCYLLHVGLYDVTFWLDAHPDGELSFDDCPLAYELSAISGHRHDFGDITILIDDMRLFSEEDQERIEAVVGAMRDDVKISRADGEVPNDILVGVM